jgi:hypothetical protein
MNDAYPARRPAGQPIPSTPVPQPSRGLVTGPVAADPARVAAAARAAAAPTLVPATAVRKAQSKYEVAIQGILVETSDNKSKAVSALCARAIERKQTIVVTFVEGQSRSFLSISPRGEVSRAAAPAPGTVLPDYSAPANQAAEQAAADSQREWVEQTLLATTATPKKKGLFRRSARPTK